MHLFRLVSALIPTPNRIDKANPSDLSTGRTIISSIPSAQLLASAEGADLDIVKFDVRPNGVPTLVTSSTAYAYDTSLGQWAIVASAWQLGAASKEAANTTSGAVDTLEKALGAVSPISQGTSETELWDDAATLGLMETRLSAALLLGSREEYRAFVARYTLLLAQEGQRGRAEDLVRELSRGIM